MNNAEFQEMQRLEGELSSSVLFQLKRESRDWDEYLAKLRAAHQAVCDAIQALSTKD